MFRYQNGLVKTSVRQLVEFLLRQGDIHSQGTLIADTDSMQAGSRIHRKIQGQQKVTYQAEVPLKMEWEQKGYLLVLEGRADGIAHERYGSFQDQEQLDLTSYQILEAEGQELFEQQLYYIDEIKGTYQNVQDIEEAKPLHLAQAKCYAAMYLKRKSLDRMGIQITYCNMETEEIKRIRTIYQTEEIEEWFQELIDSYKMWADAYVSFRKKRQESIGQLTFPFSYREGQKKLLAMVYHSICQKKKTFFQAPTGIGKTISTIYPSLKVLFQEKGEKIFYLTAKTITRTVAEDTLTLLKKQGMRLKAVTLTAKERICVNEICECNPGICDRAKGHFDRINGAIFYMLNQEDVITRDIVLDYAEQYQVCPYQLAFEAAEFCDFVICDYNYVFDPHVKRGSIQSDISGNKNILLIDEAHNLVERARDMYSADLTEEDFKLVRKGIPTSEKSLRRKISTCVKEMKKYKDRFLEEKTQENHHDAYVEFEHVDQLYFPLFRLTESLMEYLTDHSSFDTREELVEAFFRLRHFYGIMESMTEGYRIMGLWGENGFRIRLFCIDPSSQLKEILDQQLAAIFFSATLLPIPYYRNLLYGEGADAFAIPSPFDEKKRRICITNDVTSRYTRRNEKEYRKIIEYLYLNLQAQKGNYMIFFPSYEMMEQTYDLLLDHPLCSMADLVMQEPMMEENRKEEFLQLFEENREKSLLAFCVLGSIFSEGIDLRGKRLIGVLIVGTGLPKVCSERNIIRDFFDSKEKKGYDYAYRYPGMNKVLQAAGRVIRSAEDVGLITLMDERFLWRENQYLLPEDWNHYYEVSLNNYQDVIESFWQEINDTKEENNL